MERTDWSWKEPSEIGKLLLKFRRSWKVLAEVGKFELTWKVVTAVGKFIIISKEGLGKLTKCGETFQLQRNSPTSKEAFQLRSILSNFARFFPTSIGSFQLRRALSNLSQTFQLKTFQLQSFLLLVLSNCPFQLHVSRSGMSLARSIPNWLPRLSVMKIVKPITSRFRPPLAK